MQFLAGQILQPNLYNLNIKGTNLLKIAINKPNSLEKESIYSSNNLSPKSVDVLWF